jgi:hypothetical protein
MIRMTSSTAPAEASIRAPELGCEQLPAAENVQRQVAVAIIVAMEEAAFLTAVQRVVGGIQVEDDPLRNPRMGLEEQVDQPPLDGGAVVPDLVVAARRQGRVLEPVERALAGERGAPLMLRLSLPVSVARTGS